MVTEMEILLIVISKNDKSEFKNDYIIHQLPGEGITLSPPDFVEGSTSINFPNGV